MIRSCPVEISETDSCDESSPTQHIQANRERNNKKGLLMILAEYRKFILTDAYDLSETEMLNEQADQPEGTFCLLNC